MKPLQDVSLPSWSTVEDEHVSHVPEVSNAPFFGTLLNSVLAQTAQNVPVADRIAFDEAVAATEEKARQEAVAAAVAKEEKRIKRNAQARARRARQRKVCVCGSGRCRIGPFKTTEELENGDGDGW